MLSYQVLTRDDDCACINGMLLLLAYYGLLTIGCICKWMWKITGYVRKWILKIQRLIDNWINSTTDEIEDREEENHLQQFSFTDFRLLLAYYGLLTIGYVCKWMWKITGYVRKWIQKIQRFIDNWINSINEFGENRLQQLRV